jgi:hypothetical protein
MADPRFGLLEAQGAAERMAATGDLLASGVARVEDTVVE